MDMDSISNSSMMMTPYLHFVTGDYLYLKTWRPTSTGAVAGACISLVVLALFDRWLAATRGVLDLRWRQRALALTLSSSDSPKNISSINESKSKDELFDDVQEDSKHKDQNRTTLKPITARARHPRTITPFIATHDIPRGILYSLQMFMMYLLMLAVMTFQAAFFISIVVGLGIGEMLFGRLVGRMAVAPL